MTQSSTLPRAMLARQVLLFVGLVLALSRAPFAIADTVCEVDLRTHDDERYEHFVILCARKSPSWGTGHSFIVWISRDPLTGTVDSAGSGFYPGTERVVVRLFTGNGALVDESNKAASVNPDLLTHRLIVRVDREAYHASLALKQQWDEAEYDYNLLSRNCTHFAHAIGSSIGLQPPRPKLAERPSHYLDRLMAAAIQRDDQPAAHSDRRVVTAQLSDSHGN